MAEYIEKSVALLSIEHEDPTFKYAIERVPAADVVEVKHGRWVEEGCGLLVCSKCNFEYDHSGVPFEGLYYCPNCGARMDGERKDGEENGL